MALPVLVHAPAATANGCPDLTIDTNAAFEARFPSLSERISAELSRRSDLDTCARVALSDVGERAIDISVHLPDGRATSRRVTRREDIVPTLQALLLVPQPEPDPSRATPAPTPAAPPAATPSVVSPTRAEPRQRLLRMLRAGADTRDDPRPSSTKPRSFGFELSFVSGARVGDGQVSLGAGTLSFLEVKSWLIGFHGRIDRYQVLSGGDPELALALGLLAGKRFALGGTALDVTAGPAVAMKGLALSQTQSVSVQGPAPTPTPRPAEPSTGPVARLLLGARLGFAPRSVFRSFVGVDAELGQRRADEHAAAGSASLPAFAVGLALGATVGTP